MAGSSQDHRLALECKRVQAKLNFCLCSCFLQANMQYCAKSHAVFSSQMLITRRQQVQLHTCLALVISISVLFSYWCFYHISERKRRRRTLRRKWLLAYDVVPPAPLLKKKDPVQGLPYATTLKQSVDLWKDKEKWFEASFIFIESLCTGHDFTFPVNLCIISFQYTQDD